MIERCQLCDAKCVNQPRVLLVYTHRAKPAQTLRLSVEGACCTDCAPALALSQLHLFPGCDGAWGLYDQWGHKLASGAVQS